MSINARCTRSTVWPSGLGPGDIERVAAMGVDKWIDQQLHPGQN